MIMTIEPENACQYFKSQQRLHIMRGRKSHLTSMLGKLILVFVVVVLIKIHEEAKYFSDRITLNFNE